MTGHIFTLIFLFATCADFSISHVSYYNIVPSQNFLCPDEPCLTLSQFVTNISQYDYANNSNITLLFHPGNHSLAFELYLANVNNFSMAASSLRAGNTTLVRCINQSGRFRIQDSTFIKIKGLHFIGCGGNEIIEAKHFMLEDISFLGNSLGSQGSSLVLHRIANASVIRSSFILSSSATYGCGGAMYVSESSLNIVDCDFVNNNASTQGGVVCACKSSFAITTSTFANNRAPAGGVIYTSTSSFNISSSNLVPLVVELYSALIHPSAF